jgi:hypothetical protein
MDSEPARGLRAARPAGPDQGLVRVPALLPNGNGFPSSDHRLVAIDVEF